MTDGEESAGLDIDEHDELAEAPLAMDSDSEKDRKDEESLSEGEIEKTALASLDQFQDDALGSLRTWSEEILGAASRLRDVRRKRKSLEAERDKLRVRKRESEEETEQLRLILKKDRVMSLEKLIDGKKDELSKKKEELKRVQSELKEATRTAQHKTKDSVEHEEVRRNERRKHLQKLRKVLKAAVPRLFAPESAAAVVKVIDHPTAKLFHPPPGGLPPTPAQRCLHLLLAVVRGEVQTQTFLPAAKRQRVEKAAKQIVSEESDEYESYYEEEEVEESEFEEESSSQASTVSPPRIR